MEKNTEKIWHDYHVHLENFIRSKVTENFVEDLLQEVFIKIHSNIKSLKTEAKLESWLFQITRNTISDYYQRLNITEQLPTWIAQTETDDETLIRQELVSCLAPMIGKLPNKYRLPVQMSELENRTQNEVAVDQGISLSGAKSRVQRGRKLLKKMLESCCELEINKKNQITDYHKKKNSDCC